MEQPDSQQMEYVRNKLAEAYARGESPASNEHRDQREVDCPQPYWAERMTECPVSTAPG